MPRYQDEVTGKRKTASPSQALVTDSICFWTGIPGDSDEIKGVKTLAAE